jgi:enoyl-[acyl-carrier-protein] reductase (NADH)
MGVANHRSIAWACVESFLRDYDRVIFTYQNERFAKTANNLVLQATTRFATMAADCTTTTTASPSARPAPAPAPAPRLIALPCNVETDLASLFHERIPQALLCEENAAEGDDDAVENDDDDYKIDAIVHSIACAPDMQNGLLQTSKDAFLQAHAVSAYSLLETTQLALPYLRKSRRKSNSGSESEQTGNGEDDDPIGGSSITTLSYIGATRAVPNYNIMGPAKASLEALVRGLAVEIGTSGHRINAVSAGPLNTMAARGITGMSRIRQQHEQQAPLRRNVTARQVADTVRFVASAQEGATGITGQTIYVDAGYSSVVPV